MGPGADGPGDGPESGCPRDDVRGSTAPAAGGRSWTTDLASADGPEADPADRPRPDGGAGRAESADRPDREAGTDAWPAPVHAPNCDRATLLRRIVGG